MKTLVFDMYGVIIEESKGYFTPFVFSRFPFTNRTYYRELYVKASTGIIDSDEFFRTLGFSEPEDAKKEYIENHLTLDICFKPFAESFKEKYNFSLLSNDVLAWSEYIRSFHDIDRYFKSVIVSANTGYRKPDIKIFELALERLGIPASDCIFIDNSAQNLLAASKVGMDTILFNRDNEEYEGNIVNSFEELSKML